MFRLRQFLLVCEADYRGREGFHDRAYPQAADLWRLYETSRGVSLPSAIGQGRGWLHGEAIRRARVRQVALALEAMPVGAGSAGETIEDAKTGDVGTGGGAQGTEEKDQQDA